MRNLSEVNLIHKSNVYFEVVEPLVADSKVTLRSKDLMHYGEIYIYSNYLFLYDGERWYKADIQDITSIKSISNEKQILIQFKDFDLIISCEEYTHLLALRDFLFLAQQNYQLDNFLLKGAR